MLSISINQVPIASYALVQNNVDILRGITIKNSTKKSYSDLTIIIKSDPEFLDVQNLHISSLSPGETLSMSKFKLSFSSTYLCNISEKITGYTIVEIVDKDGVVLASAKKEIQILDFSQYWGRMYMPQYLAAFVTPRHPILEKVIMRASAILKRWTGNGSLTAYLHDVPNRPKQIMGAIYEAIKEEHITYCVPTSTLAKIGQKIRTVDELLSEERGKLGCCIDMALLFCSCLEAVGLHPLLIMQEEHAFAGAWLIPDMFEDSVNDDYTVVTKRIADGINEIVLVETTCANAGNNLSFDEAVKLAEDEINQTDKFVFVLDVVRARLAGVQPIPQRIFNGHEYEIINPPVKKESHCSPIHVGETYSFNKIAKDDNRFDYWERRLLDLSPRNNLLNVHFTKGTLRIMSVPLHILESRLSAGAVFYISDRPEDWKNSMAEKDLNGQISEIDPIHDLLREELDNDRLRSFQKDTMLSRSLTTLYRAARLSLEESGANTLYLALGFLQWTEVGKMSIYYAPIILYPVKLERKSANKGYTLCSRGEEPILNETLFEYLKQNHNLEMPFSFRTPDEGKGLDITYVLAAVRKAVMEQDRWDVKDEAVLGIFDFNKFVIWNDIRNNRDEMMKNAIVKSLVDGVLSIDEVDNCHVDKITSSEIALPLSADSSQLDAIVAAAHGNSFVLHGPPGTGKSQTITNIIANALFHGKRILFVSEKMAALDVVQKRLADIGLAPFCLELHSNKTKKSLVMDQLRSTTEIFTTASDETFNTDAEIVDNLKNELNSHVEKLHKIQKIGLSIYDCFVGYSQINEDRNVRFQPEYIASLTPDRYNHDLEIIEDYESVASATYEMDYPLKEIGIVEYNPFIRTEISEKVKEALLLLEELSVSSFELFSSLKISDKEFSKNDYQALRHFSGLVIDKNISNSILVNREKLLPILDETIKIKKELEHADHVLALEYFEDIQSISCSDIRLKWQSAKFKWVIPMLIEKRNVTNLLSSFRKDGRKITEKEVSNLLDMLDKVRSLKTELDIILKRVPDCSLELSRMSAEKLLECKYALKGFSESLILIGSERENLINNIGDSREVLSAFCKSYDDFMKTLTELEDKSCAHLVECDGDWLKYVRCTLFRWRENINNLRIQSAYNIRRKAVEELGLTDLVRLFEEHVISPDSITKIYRKCIYRYCADYYLSMETSLTSFQGVLFEDKIKKFRKICKEFEDATRKELLHRMSRMMPSFQKEAAQTSDVGILQKNIRNGCRGLSIRKLFETIPELISRMCPAMLMSPLSVSQYLGKEWPKFDIVIFDEASQMPTCEAVAAISRGKSTIVVGDECQLPPTNFFISGSYSEQHSEVSDLESVLDDCLALSMPQKHLLWHYRSKHESLIAFSNRHFYKNALKTFPSNDDMANKVSFHYVNGIYDRGRGRNNKAEAKAVIDEIRRHLENSDERNKSIGVVTFNVNQQSLIEDMLNDLFKKNPELERIATENKEQIFIKNLENVQGDERDVIIFSVGYGRDNNNRVAMNFGPLNRDGGERRLNVAVSRARCQMKIFSSLKAEDIDIYRSNAKGVLYLKAFLAYAEKGTVTYDIPDLKMIKKTQDAFVESLAESLRLQGYSVNTNVGESEYRVDIGIVDPENNNKYILGILCDGYNYTVSQTARDRNITTPYLLETLGWRIMNIWSIEWWDTPQLVISQINNYMRSIKDVLSKSVSNDDSENKESSHFEQNGRKSLETREVEYIHTEIIARESNSTNIAQGEFTDSIVKHINMVIENEAPISKHLLVKKMLKAYGISRNSIRLNAYFSNVFREMELFSNEHGDTFYWKNEEQMRTYSVYRKASGREAYDIAPEEVVNAALQILEEQFAMNEETLVRETARLLGFANVRENVALSMKRGITLGLSKRLFEMDGKRYRINYNG